MTTVFAWLLAWLLGLSLWCALAGRPRGMSAWIAAIGYAIPLGLLACALTIRIPSVIGYRELSSGVWWWPIVALLVFAAVAAWRGRTLVRTSAPLSVAERWSGLQIALVALLALLVAIRAYWLYEESMLRPLFGWDAWLAWSAKAKAWVLSGHATPYVDSGTWLNAEPGSVRTSLAYNYPESLSWLQVWLSGPAGTWSEPDVNFAWPVLWLGLLLGCYGQWRALGVSSMAAAVGTYLLASLPLANVHAALPGYADLWVATLFAFSVLSILRWQMHGERGQLLLAVALMLVLPTIKFEGTVWALSALALILWFGFATRGRTIRVTTVLLVVGLLTAISWLSGFQWTTQVINLFTGPGENSQLTDVLSATAVGLFTQDNWHLLWYVLPVVVVWQWPHLRSSSVTTGLLLLLVACLSLLLALFVGTVAGRWVESYTIVNRLVLHIAPIALSLIVLLLGVRREAVASAINAEPVAHDIPR